MAYFKFCKGLRTQFAPSARRFAGADKRVEAVARLQGLPHSTSFCIYI
jgi:hypothetical protein